MTHWKKAFGAAATALMSMAAAAPTPPLVRDAQARLSDMIQTQPVAAELPQLHAPETLIIGQRDLTAFRAGAAPAAIRSQVQTVPQAAETAVKPIPGARLVRLDAVGLQSLLDAIGR